MSRDLPPPPGQDRSGSGLGSGELFDTCLPGADLAGAADKAAGAARDFADLNDDELIGTLRAFDRMEAWSAAGKAAAAVELARRRPAVGRDRAIRAGKTAPWGTYCADELAAALATSRNAAERMLAVAYDLSTRLPETSRALNEGVISWYKAQVIAEATRMLSDNDATAAEALVLPTAGGKTPAQIRSATGRAVLNVDPEGARKRREEALKDARVELWREDAGTAALCGFHLPPDEALAADQAITALALDLKAAGCPGAMDQLRVRAYLDILLGKDTRQSLNQQQPATSSARADGGMPSGGQEPGTVPTSAPGEPGSAAAAAKINLTIPLATLLGLADNPGEAAGFGPIDADLARDLAARAATSRGTSWCVTVTDQQGHPSAHGCAKPGRRKKAKRKKGRGGLPFGNRAGPPASAGPPGGYGTWRLRPVARGPDLTVDLEPIPVTDCDHRHETAAHDPSDKLRHLVRIRDGECTWPPCRCDAQSCDFEHAIPWEQGGRTCACNAGPRCRHHHRQKQGAGWHLEQHVPGYHTWTTPAGRSYTSGPITYPI